MKKIASSFIILSGSFILGSNLVLANSEDVTYDLNHHDAIESFELIEDGELINITILDDSFTSKMVDKTYTVSKSKSNSWSISYKVTVKNNKITSAHSGSFKASQGSFSNTSVTRSSNSLAVGKGAWKYRAATNTIQVKTSVVNNNLKVQ